MPVESKRRKLDSSSDNTDCQQETSCNTTKQIMSNSNCKMIWEVKNKEGYTPLRLYHPYDVSFLLDNRVVVVEGFWPYSRIQVMDMNGKTILSIAQGNILPFGITVDGDGNMAVTDHKDKTVKFFTIDGQPGPSWSPHMFDWPDGITLTADNKYLVTDWEKGTVSQHDHSGSEMLNFSTKDDSSERSCPTYITVDQHKRILITDSFKHEVKIFDPSGKFLKKFGNSLETDSSNLNDPRGITIDALNNILVADWGSGLIKKYNPDAEYIGNILNDGDSKVEHPWGIATSRNGLLLVSEQKLDRKKPKLKLFNYI